MKKKARNSSNKKGSQTLLTEAVLMLIAVALMAIALMYAKKRGLPL